MTQQGIITIREGREKPIRNQHPWIFSGAIAKAEHANDGDIVTVVDHRGNFLGRGYWNHQSQIQVRILTWVDEAIDAVWWQARLRRALMSRWQTAIMTADEGDEEAYPPLAYRLINAENDFLPGLIVDRYGDWLVLQALTLYIDQHKTQIATWLAAILNERSSIKGVYERSDVDVREREGLGESVGVLWGEAPPEAIEIYEAPFTYLVDVYHGHKTGFYLDQAENRRILTHIRDHYDTHEERLRLLNLFCYTGTFTPAVADWGDTISTGVDASEDALAMAERIYHLNNLDSRTGNEAQWLQADVFDYLRACIERGDQYDFVILDPPKFAHNKRQVDRASRGYKDINLNAFKVIKPGGYLMTFSCSGAISRDLFQKIVFGALADSGRTAQIVRHLSASEDHPVALTFPEGEYLKGLLLRVY